jgi:hypothetical protein
MAAESTKFSFNATEFIKLLENVLIEIDTNRRLDLSDTENINLIQQKYNELLHIKDVNRMDPTLDEHYGNIKLLLEEFMVKSEDPGFIKLFEDYEKKNSYPSGCLDSKIRWFDTFIRGESNTFSATDMTENIKTLGIMINKIVKKLCDQEIKTKEDYIKWMSKKELFTQIVIDGRVQEAIEQRKITSQFVRDFLDNPAYGWDIFKHESKDVLDCNKKIDDLPNAKKLPSRLNSKTLLFDKDNIIIGETINETSQLFVDHYVITDKGSIRINYNIKFNMEKGTQLLDENDEVIGILSIDYDTIEIGQTIDLNNGTKIILKRGMKFKNMNGGYYNKYIKYKLKYNKLKSNFS